MQDRLSGKGDATAATAPPLPPRRGASQNSLPPLLPPKTGSPGPRPLPGGTPTPSSGVSRQGLAAEVDEEALAAAEERAAEATARAEAAEALAAHLGFALRTARQAAAAAEAAAAASDADMRAMAAAQGVEVRRPAFPPFCYTCVAVMLWNGG